MLPVDSLSHVYSLVCGAVTWIAAWIWPRLNGRASIRRVAAAGALVCCLIGADYFDVRGSWTEQLPADFTLFAVTLSLLSGALWFSLGWGVYRLSRFASISALGLYLAGRIELFAFRWMRQLRLATTTEIAMSAIAALLLINAVRASLMTKRLRGSPRGERGDPPAALIERRGAPI